MSDEKTQEQKYADELAPVVKDIFDLTETQIKRALAPIEKRLEELEQRLVGLASKVDRPDL